MRPPLLAAAALAVCLASPALARTWEITVDGLGDAPTIQAGVDSSSAGDTVWVAPGTYYESIDLLGKAIHLLSSSGPETTILDGSQSGTAVVLCRSHEPHETVIEGFTIQGGSGVQVSNEKASGGVYIREAEPTIVGNIITHNYAPTQGGGIGCIANSGEWFPIIRDNVIGDNLSENLGGAISCSNYCAPQITGNSLIGNTAVSGDGGAISLLITIDGTRIVDNVILNNAAGDHGGGIYGARVTSLRGPLEMEISGNVIGNNVARGGLSFLQCGGGVWISGTNAWIHHNTMVGNGCESAAPSGGALVLRKEGSPLVERNIIAFTWQGAAILCADGATPDIKENLTWANLRDGSGTCDPWSSSNGNRVGNPLFCDYLGGIYTLAEGSPALTLFPWPVGAFPDPACAAPVPVRPITWGRLKTRYQ